MERTSLILSLYKFIYVFVSINLTNIEGNT